MLKYVFQTAFSLAAAENAFEFEHRDLHWGNILISKTTEKSTTHVLNGVKYEIPTKGVKVSIIDFTLSRVVHEDCCVFNDLSLDPTLFQSHGDYQFEIYRMMQRELKSVFDINSFLYKNESTVTSLAIFIYSFIFVCLFLVMIGRFSNRKIIFIGFITHSIK